MYGLGLVSKSETAFLKDFAAEEEISRKVKASEF